MSKLHGGSENAAASTSVGSFESSRFVHYFCLLCLWPFENICLLVGDMPSCLCVHIMFNYALTYIKSFVSRNLKVFGEGRRCISVTVREVQRVAAGACSHTRRAAAGDGCGLFPCGWMNLSSSVCVCMQ